MELNAIKWNQMESDENQMKIKTNEKFNGKNLKMNYNDICPKSQ